MSYYPTPDADGGRWTKRVRGEIVLPGYTPSFRTPSLAASFALAVHVECPGPGNDVNLAIPITLVSAAAPIRINLPVEEQAPPPAMEPEASLPPSYWEVRWAVDGRADVAGHGGVEPAQMICLRRCPCTSRHTRRVHACRDLEAALPDARRIASVFRSRRALLDPLCALFCHHACARQLVLARRADLALDRARAVADRV